MPETPWTIATVKDQLPEVPVGLRGKTVAGRLTGRLNRFASVTIPGQDGMWVTFDVAWDTVVSCLNRQKPVRL